MNPIANAAPILLINSLFVLAAVGLLMLIICMLGMENKIIVAPGKRMKLAIEEKGKDSGMSTSLENEECQKSTRGSEEIESNIAQLLEKIESFTQLATLDERLYSELK